MIDTTCDPNCQYFPPGTERASDGSIIQCPVNCANCQNGICSNCVATHYLNTVG